MTGLSLRQIFAAPLALAALSVIGLVLGLVADGVGDWLSWLALAAVPATALWYLWPRGARPKPL